MDDDFFITKIFNVYYEDVGKYPILTTEEEREYLARYKICPNCKKSFSQTIQLTNCPECGTVITTKIKGRILTCPNCMRRFDKIGSPTCCSKCGSPRDIEAREKILLSNLRFVVTLARKYTKNPRYIQRLISAGNVGLIIALDKFDVTKNTKFLTYAAWWVRKEMNDELHASGLIHIPSHKQKTFRRNIKEGEYVCSHCGDRVTHPSDSYSHCVELEHEYLKISNLEAYNTFLPLDDIEIGSSDIEALAIDDNSAQFMRKILNKLNLRIRDLFIILQYYNIPGEDRKSENKTLPQLASITGITPERVRQIKIKILQDLRKELKRRSVQNFSDVCF
jgi:RNA polymerase primary sigma factor